MLKLSRFQRMNLRASFSGNTLAEYALPLALVVVSGGVIMTVVNANGLIPNYLADASGSSVSGNTINGTVAGADFAGAALGNGSGGGDVGMQATIIGGGGGGIFITGGGYGGSPETVGGNGNGRGITTNLPAPKVRLPDGNPDLTVASYPDAVRKSVQTNRKIEATSDPAALQRLAVQKYVDNAQVHVAASQDPDGYEKYGGQAERDIDDVARGETIDKASDGDNGVKSQTKEECDTVDGNCGSDSNNSSGLSAGGFWSGFMEALIAIMRNPNDTAAAANEKNAEKFITSKITELKAKVEAEAAKAQAALDAKEDAANTGTAG